METKKILPLSLSSIDEAYVFVQEMLEKYKCSKADTMKVQLFVEEAIVYWQERADDNVNFELAIQKRFKTITISLNYRGESINPLFVGNIYDITFSFADMIPVAVLSLILSVAVPPSPGMAAFLFTIIFNLLGIPLEGLALAVVIGIFMDYPVTAVDVLVINTGMLHTEHRLKMSEIK